MRPKLIILHSSGKVRKKSSYVFEKLLLNSISEITMQFGLLYSSLIILDAFIISCLKKLKILLIMPSIIALNLLKSLQKLFLRMKLKNLKTFSQKLLQKYRKKFLINIKRKCAFMIFSFRLLGLVWGFSACVLFPLSAGLLSRARAGDTLLLRIPVGGVALFRGLTEQGKTKYLNLTAAFVVAVLVLCVLPHIL